MGLSAVQLLPVLLGVLAGLMSDELVVWAPMVVEAEVGATTILNCTFHPPAEDLILYWTRLNSAGGTSSVYIHYQGKVDTRFTDPTYVTRSSLVGDPDKGDASLRLGPLSPADRGTYCCRVKHAHGTGVAETQLHVLNSSRLDTPWTLQTDPSNLMDTTAPPHTQPWVDANTNSAWAWTAGLGGGAVVVLGVLWAWHRRRMHGGISVPAPPPTHLLP